MKLLSPTLSVKKHCILLFFVLVSIHAAVSQQRFGGGHTYFKDPHSPKPSELHHGSSTFRSVCDNISYLDYSAYDEFIATEKNFNFSGSWTSSPTSPQAQEISCFLDTLHEGDFSYAQAIWDSIAFINIDVTSYYPLSATTIYLDSLGMFIGISGDTIHAHGTMTHDSLVFSIYSVDNTDVTLVKKVVLSGYAQLNPFFRDPYYLGYNQVPIHQQFSRGQGFAVRMDYLAKDTSSHLLLSYTYADSCGQVSYQGSTIASPAYPSTFSGRSLWGHTYANAQGTGAMVTDENSNLTYDGYGWPVHCSYVYTQNWEFLPIINTCVDYGAQIQASSTTICNGSIVNLNAFVYGTNSGNITYSWSTSSGTLTDATSSTTGLTQNTNSNITVTLTVNDGDSITTASMVFINCNAPMEISAGVNDSVCNGSIIALNPTVSGGTGPYNYHWSGNGLNCTNCKNPLATITQNSTYNLTVTDAHSNTATASVNYSVSSTISQLQLLLESPPVTCNNQTELTTATVIGGNLPISINWGDGSTSTGGPLQTHSYTHPGQRIVKVTDAQGCTTASLDSIETTGMVVSLEAAVEPACPGTASGKIVVAVTGGTAPYTYYWNGAVGSDSLINISPGSYSVGVTDAALCHANFTYTLNPTADANYYVFLNSVNPNCGSPGSVTANIYGGTAPYTYLWSNSDTTSSININSGGFSAYGVVVTDSLGCTVSGNTYVQNGCSSFITGMAFVDGNSNCVLDGNEQPLQNAFIAASSSTGSWFYGITDQNGQYSIEVPDTGIYGLSLYNEFSVCGNTSLCGNSNQTVYLPTLGGNSANNNFAFLASSGFELGIFPSWSSANPGFEKYYSIYYYNVGSQPFTGNATIAFKYDSNLIYMGSDVAPTAFNAENDSITWNVHITGNDFFGAIGAVYFKVPVTLSLSYQLQTKFWIYPFAGDCDTSDNYLHFSELVTGSHDPNEKEVQPAGNITADDSVLTYTIHFQNTGTDSTHFIIVTDTLSPNLDPATVRNLAASYKYSDFKVSGAGILTWTFNPYRLVDSITNPAGSKGFVSFSVKQKKNLPVGSPISNTASIYFDYNEPVVTNTVTDTVASPTGVMQVTNMPGITVTAFPNPFSNFTNIEVTGIHQKFDFELFDLTGRLQNRIPQIGSGNFELQRNNLAGGVYLYRILVSGKPAAFGKLVIE